MNIASIIFNLLARTALGWLLGIGCVSSTSAIAERIARKRISRELLERALKNRAFNSEELIREADKLAHDDNESDNARDFAKRVYIVGRVAQEAQEGNS